MCCRCAHKHHNTARAMLVQHHRQSGYGNRRKWRCTHRSDLGLLAQQYTPFEASLLGVYLHGLAGDMAANEMGMESLIASDLIKHIPKAFKKLK